MEKLSDDIMLVQNIVQEILKVKKTVKLYPSNNPIYIKAVQEAQDKLKRFFNFHDELKLKIFQNEITFNNEQVYSSSLKEENFALFFFKDGIKEITFLKGFTQEELEDLLRVLNTDFENIALDDDLVTLLWEKEFEHFKYVADDSFLFDESDEEIERKCNGVKENLYSDEDLTKAYNDGLQTVEKAEFTAIPLTDEDYKYIAKEIIKDESTPKIDKVITIVLELLSQTTEKTALSEISGFIEKLIV
jgi:hypothetical protein